MIKSIDSILKWITAGLGAGYIATNVLKWFWWRLNGYGYFAGMMVGIVLATLSEKGMDLLFPEYTQRFAGATDNFSVVLALFPVILLLSGLTAVITSLLTRPDDEEALKQFYRQVRPWGFWEPIHQKVMRETPDFRRNTAFKRDMLNIAVGLVWHTLLAAVPIYLVIREMKPFLIALVLLIVTSLFLKMNWYDKLEEN